MGEVIFQPEAKAELDEAAAWYEKERAGLGARFLAAIEKAAHELLRGPVRWRRIRGPYRRALVNDFPYGLIYEVIGDSIHIIAVIHHKRRPGYWYDRV